MLWSEWFDICTLTYLRPVQSSVETANANEPFHSLSFKLVVKFLKLKTVIKSNQAQNWTFDSYLKSVEI